MMLMHPNHVVPSNAPPDGGGVHQASRVLQEHSGNRQQNDFLLKNEFEQKYPSSLLTKNHYQSHYENPAPPPPPLPQHQYTHHYHPRPQHRQPVRYGTHRGQYGQFGPEEEARTRVEADRLYQRFKKSDQYVKYRQRQTKDDKGNGDQKWPDHLEKAFFLGELEIYVSTTFKLIGL